MMTTDARKYVRQMGLDSLRVAGSAAAKRRNLFALANEFAVRTTVGEKVSIAFACPAGGHLNEIPVNCCARA